MTEMEIGNCEQVWQTVIPTKCNRHGENDETTFPTFKEDFETIVTNIVNIQKTMADRLNSTATRIEIFLKKMSDLSQNLPKPTTLVLNSYKKKSLDLLQNLANPSSVKIRHPSPVLNSDQPSKFNYFIMERPTSLNSTDCYSGQENLLFYSSEKLYGPSSLWIFYRIVAEALRKKKTLNMSSLTVFDSKFVHSN